MNELEQKLDEYSELFGESFPTFNFMWMSPQEMEEIIDSCLDTGKDVYELEYVENDENVKY